MVVLSKTDIRGEIVYLGVVRDRDGDLRSLPVEEASVSFAGFDGESHAGLTRQSCTRVKDQYPVGTEIRNVRQISILSVEEMAETATAMGIDELKPEWVGASLVLRGIPMLTQLPPSARLIFDSGLSLVVDMENAPCQLPGREIERFHPGKGKLYKPSAANRRGVTAWVERPGMARLGSVAVLHAPPQRQYPPLLSTAT